MTWPWGTYLGEEALEERHPHEGLELAAHAAERHPARLEGDGRLPQLDARRAPRRRTPATTRRSCSRPRAPSPTGRARRSSSSRKGTIYTPDLSTGILHGITRDSIIQIAADLGYTVLEKTLIRSDLYLADEVFMCGTAAEVTPVRSVDDHEIGVGDVTRELQKAYLDTVRGVSDRWSQWRELVAERDAARRVSTATRRINLSAPWIDERDEELVLEVLRSGHLSLGPTGPRFESLLAEAVGAPYCAAVSSGTAGLHLCMRARRRRAGRRGDHVAVLVRRLGELRDLRGRDAGLRRHRPAHAATSTRPRSRRRSRRARRRSSRSTSTAIRASSTS